MVLLSFGAGCATYSDIPLDQQSVDATGGGGAASAVTTNDSTNDGAPSAGTGGSMTTGTGAVGTGGDGSGAGGATVDTTSSGGASVGSGGDGGGTNPSSGGVAGQDGSGGGTEGTGASVACGGAGGVDTGSGGTGGTGGDLGNGGTGGSTATTAFRYVRLVALSSQNGSVWTAVAEFELLDEGGQPIESSGLTASADSEEAENEPGAASRAIDGDSDTYWHTEWGDYDAPLPHYLQIDLGSAQEITGFVYTPRQGGVENGWILEWELYLSNSASDPGTAVATGTFPFGQDVQTVNLP